MIRRALAFCTIASALLCAGWAGLIQAQPSDAELTARMEREFRTVLPAGTKVTVLGPRSLRVEFADGTSNSISLDNLAVNCRNNPGGCDEFIRRMVAGMTENRDRTKADPSALRIVLRGDQYVRQIGELIARSPKPEENRIVSKPFMAGAHLVYMIDTPNTMIPLSQAGLKELNLSPEQLHAVALKNLASLPPIQFRRVAEPEIYLLPADDYTSSQVLLAERWPAVTEKFGNRLVMAVPNRNFVFLVDGNKPASVRALRNIAAEAVQKYPYSISPELFEWTPGGWKLLRP